MIASRHYPAPGPASDRLLLVMLPGVGFEADEFEARGFVAAVHRRGWPVDIIAGRPELDLYLEGNIASALHDHIVSPAMSRGYARLWFLGISLGGMGALLYAAAQLAPVEGMVLLALLGTPGTIADISSAGGISAWDPQHSRATVGKRRMLRWLQDVLAQPPAPPVLYLGYGRGDRFAAGHRLLAAVLPQERVAAIDGDHNWESWSDLWRQILERNPFRLGTGDASYVR